MTNKEFYTNHDSEEFYKRDKAVQFGCWLAFNYHYRTDLNQFVRNNKAHVKPDGYAEQLFDFWWNLQYGEI